MNRGRTEWKDKINEWCNMWGIPAPTFLLTQRELRRILLRGNSKWDRFTKQHPDIFDGDEWKEEEIKAGLKDVYSFLLCKEIYGPTQGMYSVLWGGVDIIAIDDGFTHSKRTLRHEFFHCLNEHRGYFNERMVEDQAKKFEKHGKIEGSTWVMLRVRICRYLQFHHAKHFWTKGTKGMT